MFNILITSSSRKISLIHAFQKALKKLHLEGQVYIADTSSLSASFYISSKTVISPRTEDKRYLNWLITFCSKNKIRLIIPTRDEELTFFATHKNIFLSQGIYINICDKEIIRICRDKKAFYHYCQIKSFTIPEMFSKKDTIRYPCFVKGRFGKGSKFAFKIDDEKQLKAFLLITPKVIIQEYLDWPEYTVDYFADFKGNPISVVPRERIFTVAGESFIGKTVKDKFIINQVIKLASSLKLIGHNTIQLFYNKKDKAIKFNEINPRYGGGVALSIRAGANTPMFLIRLINNLPIKYKMYDFKNNLYMLRYTQDVFVQEEDLKK